MVIKIIRVPFTKEQVNTLNKYQESEEYHPYTCGGFEGCKRTERKDEGKLIATKDGWICPCGKYKQNWAYLKED